RLDGALHVPIADAQRSASLRASRFGGRCGETISEATLGPVFLAADLTGRAADAFAAGLIGPAEACVEAAGRRFAGDVAIGRGPAALIAARPAVLRIIVGVHALPATTHSAGGASGVAPAGPRIVAGTRRVRTVQVLTRLARRARGRVA